MIEVLEPGMLTTIQDLGRPGYAHLGVSRSGAADRESLRLANRLVGNAPNAPALEATFAGPKLEVRQDVLAALTGAPASPRLDGQPIDMYRASLLRAGSTLDVGQLRAGLRTYIAFAGGVLAPTVFGSASTDTMSGLGPPLLAPGSRLHIGSERGHRPVADVIPFTEPPNEVRVRLLLGPRDDWIKPDAIRNLGIRPFEVDSTSDRVGIRLAGPVIEWAKNAELRSEGVVPGAMQVPPSGHPIILLADHPTTGGYPVVGCVPEQDVDQLAQLRPGSTVRFDLRRPQA